MLTNILKDRRTKSIFLIVIGVAIIIFLVINLGQKQVTTIVFAGDLLLDRGVRERVEHLGMNSLFDPSIDDFFSNKDIVIANLECPATKIKEPINKKFIFRAEPEWLQSLRDHGITHLNMANNHAMDQGRRGLVDTHATIIENGLIPLGFGKNTSNACKAQLIATEPRNVYVLSSLQVPSENWVYLEDRPCVCEDSFDDISHNIKEIKSKDNSAVVIIQLHWGAEHRLEPMTLQKQQAHQLIDAGADVIIGHHPHTVQTTEIYKEKPIYYSIGNFIFDQRKPINSRGLLVRLEIKESTLHYTPIGIDIKKCVPRVISLQE